MRSPGASFGAAQKVDSEADPGGAAGYALDTVTAAGPDGTLAAAFEPDQCPASGSPYVGSIQLVLLPPSAATATEQTVPGSTCSAALTGLSGTTSELATSPG